MMLGIAHQHAAEIGGIGELHIGKGGPATCVIAGITGRDVGLVQNARAALETALHIA
ncbi:MAG: hypothetical protein JF627_04885 [Alphaproteobacteria bacterium]|nr:hypothetical protein [Alphaproteobacteria bacterium]